MLEKITYKKPLIIGTGGGNDIVSASLVLAELQRQGIYSDLAGICAPGAIHFYKGIKEDSLNEVSEETERFIESKNKLKISFIDGNLPNLLAENNLSASVYNLSGRYGTSRLIKQLEDLIRKNNYDGIIAVDVGGDILAREKEDSSILSPLMDFTTLYAVSQLKTPSILVEFGLQTDGELRPRGCNEILNELAAKKIILAESGIHRNDSSVLTFESIYNSISNIRRGHTGVMTLKTLESENDINTLYKFRMHILDKTLTYDFPITLESRYFGKVFTFDLKELARNRARAFAYENYLELFLKTKKIADTKTELDLLYNDDSGALLWFATTGPQIQGRERFNFLNYGLEKLESHADVALLWKKDAEDSRIKLTKYQISINDFIITSPSLKKLEKTESKIRRYLK
jgi:hypothetical protein